MSDATFDAPYRQIVTPAPIPRTRRHAPVRGREALALIGLVLGVDFSSWEQPYAGFPTSFGLGGLGLAAIPVTATLALFVATPRWRRSRRLAVIVGLSMLLALRTAILPSPATTLAMLALWAALPLALRSRRVSVLEAGTTTLRTALAIPSRVLAVGRSLAQLGARLRVTGPSLVAIALPLALTTVFFGVLALANPVLADGALAARGWISQLTLPCTPRVVIACVVACVGLLAMRPAPSFARDDEAARSTSAAHPLEIAVARNALLALNVLFLAHHALDATYLWSGRPPEGMTTQTYAHHGALWLTVALAMLTMVIAGLFRGALVHDPRARTVRVLAYAWIAQGMLLALGTYRRIAIHVAHTGLSDLRILGVIGTTVVVGGVLLVAYGLHARRSGRWLVRRQLDALALGLVVYALLPTHWIAAQVDVARIQAGERGPMMHLEALAASTESATVLLPLLEHPDGAVRVQVASALQDDLSCLGCEIVNRVGWQREDLSTRGVYDALVAARPRIHAALGHRRREPRRRSRDFVQ